MTKDTENLKKVDIDDLKIDHKKVTASADELNKLDGITSTVEELNILHGVTKTAAQINALLAAVTAGKKIAFGTKAVGAASEDVVTGLTTVEYAFCSMVGDPSATHCMSTCTVGNQTGAPAAGSIRIKSWKFTAANDNALIAAAGVFANVSWIAIGV